ncbi:MAG: phosphate ABC transporter permease family protein, partial [Pseudomonadota bacterium]
MTTMLLILLIAAAGYYLGWRRALTKGGGKVSALHSLPGHYAWYVALLCAGPALAVWLGWMLFGDLALRAIIVSRLPADIANQSSAMIDFFFTDVRRMAAGLPPNGTPNDAMVAAAALYSNLNGIGTVAFIMGSLALAAGGVAVGLSRVNPSFRARNSVENWVSYCLLIAAGVSIMTTA